LRGLSGYKTNTATSSRLVALVGPMGIPSHIGAARRVLCVGSRAGSASAHLADALSAGVPLKLAVRVEDLLEEAAPGQAQLAFGLRSAQLASAAMSLEDVDPKRVSDSWSTRRCLVCSMSRTCRASKPRNCP
jgi:hypothetical protein